MDAPVFLTLAEVLEIHTDQVCRYGGGAGARDLALLQSALAQPEASFAGEWLHDGLHTMAAAYAYHICQNHPFIDGNKRAALACALVFLGLNSVELRDPTGRLRTATMAVAQGKMSKEALTPLFQRLSSHAP